MARRQFNRLSAVALRKLSAQPGMHPDGAGLYLQVSRAGVPSWIFRYMVDSRERYHGLGPYPLVGLAEAREKALKCRRMRLDGVDPIEQRRAKRVEQQAEAAKVMTFRQCAEAYIAAQRVSWKNAKHAAQWPQIFEAHAYPIFGALPVSAIDTRLVVKAVEPIWATKPATANRVRNHIELVLDWAKVRDFRQGENPARWRGHLDKLLPRVGKVRPTQHRAALPYPEIASFMDALHRHEGVAARALEFAILTAARTGEVLNALWSEINLAERLWIVPANRMKAGKEHRVPLSDAALAILGIPGQPDQFVFSGRRPGAPLADTAFQMLLRRMKRGDLTAHGFRSTFRDWAAERTSFPHEVAEMALAHIVGNRTEAAYRRSDLFQKRRQLADAWTRFCAAPATGEVVAIRS